MKKEQKKNTKSNNPALPKIKSQTSYWEEFNNNYPDQTEFRPLIASDPILTKIFNFCSFPSIWEGIRTYPFDEKIRELKTITNEDKAHLDKLLFQPDLSKGKIDYLEYLANLFQVVSATVMLQGGLNKENIRQGRFSTELILERVESCFRRAISVDVLVKGTDKKGNATSVRSYGRFFPFRWVRVIETTDNDQGVFQTIYQEHYIFPPTGEQVEQDLRELDKFSVTSQKKYGVDTFSASDDPKFLLGKVPGTKKFLVQLYYKDKLLKEFVFRTQERYRPLARKHIEKIKAKYPNILRTNKKNDFLYMTILGAEEDFFVDFDLKLKEKVEKYNDKSPVYPAGYLKKAMAHFGDEIKQKHSSQTGVVPCNKDCKALREQKGNPPCEFENEMGYCKDPKKQERIRSLVEYSGGSLDDLLPNDVKNELTRGDLVTLEDLPIEEQLFKSHLHSPEDRLLAQEEKKKDLSKIHKDAPKLEAIIAKKEEKRGPMTPAERQIKSRAKKKAQEKYKKG